MEVYYKIFKPGEMEVNRLVDFLTEADNYAIPSLSTLVNIGDYAVKLAENATLFTALVDSRIVGLSAVYVNKAPLFSFCTYLCALKPYQHDMVGIEVLMNSINYCKEYGSEAFRGEIRKTNKPLWNLYKRLGFSIVEEKVYPNTDVQSAIIELKY